MTGWLLWVAGERPDSPVWAPYIALLPPGDQVRYLTGTRCDNQQGPGAIPHRDQVG